MVRITFSGRPPSYRTRSLGFRPYLGRELFRIAPSDTLVPFSMFLESNFLNRKIVSFQGFLSSRIFFVFSFLRCAVEEKQDGKSGHVDGQMDPRSLCI